MLPPVSPGKMDLLVECVTWGPLDISSDAHMGSTVTVKYYYVFVNKDVIGQEKKQAGFEGILYLPIYYVNSELISAF